METRKQAAAGDTQHSRLSYQSEANLSGRRLGDYQLMRRLGRGGMADVYLAEQGSLRRQVAFKVLHASLSGDESYVRRFHNEAQAAAALVHANIVQIYEVGCIDAIHFIAQEYVAGQNLKQALSRSGPLGLKEAVSIMKQVAAALQKADSRGIIHRDIKPENIMLASTGEVKVADFGLARVIRDGGRLDLTQVGVTLGTPLYMSPEQVEGGAVDHRSDLYSLGVSSYQMLAGRTPFESETALGVAVKHLKETPQPLSELRPDLPDFLCQLIHQLLAKSSSQRVQSATDLLDQLVSLSAGGPAPISSDTVPIETATSVSTDLSMTATQQLQAVMRAEKTRPTWRATLIRLAATIVVSFVLGGAAAWLWQPPSLLEVSGNELPRIERMESAAAQFGHAMQLASERALESVLEYFPPDANAQNELYGYKAKLHLAYLYEDMDRPDDALLLYRELAEQELDSQLRAIGLTGQANIYGARGSRLQASQKLHQLVQWIRQSGPLGPGQRRAWSQRLIPQLRSDFQSKLEELRALESTAPNGRNRPPDGS